MTTVNTSATAASAASDLNGMAIKNACDQLNARLAPYREKMPNATFQEVSHAAYFDRVHLSAVGHYKTPDIGFNWVTKEGKPFFYFTQVSRLLPSHVVVANVFFRDREPLLVKWRSTP